MQKSQNLEKRENMAYYILHRVKTLIGIEGIATSVISRPGRKTLT